LVTWYKLIINFFGLFVVNFHEAFKGTRCILPGDFSE
jgi:hypothetical protein